MTTRRIVLYVLAGLLLLGIGNFAFNAVTTRRQLGLVASKDPKQQEEGVKGLMARGVLFDALQGGAPPATRLAAIASLQRLAGENKNPQAFKELIQMLKDPDTESAEAKTHPVRDAATAAVAAVGALYPDPLLNAAKDPDKSIQDESRKALKKIGAPLKEQMAARLGDGKLRAPLGDILSSVGPETVPLIVPYLSSEKLPPAEKPDDVAKAKVELIETLGKFKVPEAATPIIPFKNDTDPNVRRTVVTSLSNIADPVGAPVLIEALQSPATDASARAAAAGALGQIATPEANRAMVEALDDYDLSVAEAAAAGLRRAGEKASTAIAASLANPAPAVRARVADAAGGMRTPTLAIRALSDADAGVRAQAAESLGEIIVRAGLIRVDLARLVQPDPVEQEKALRSLMTGGFEMELLRKGVDPAARASAVAALATLSAGEKNKNKQKEYNTLREKLEDPVVRAQEGQVAPLPEQNAAVMTPLLTALGDADGTVATNAATALSRIGAPAVSLLVARLTGAEGDTTAYFASQALQGVGAAAVDPLVSVVQQNGSGSGARWAAITLGEIGDARAAPALEGLRNAADPDTAAAAVRALAKVRPT